MKSLVVIVLGLSLALAGCANQQPAQWQSFTYSNCRPQSGIEVCDVVLSGGKSGITEKRFIEPGGQLREDMVH